MSPGDGGITGAVDADVTMGKTGLSSSLNMEERFSSIRSLLKSKRSMDGIRIELRYRI